jgi:pimeloyl-ACP methyl ester carboxylesterase
LLWGDYDSEVPLSYGEQLRDAISNARLIVFRDCGHLPHEEFPKAFTEVVSDFCSTEPGAEDSRVSLEA